MKGFNYTIAEIPTHYAGVDFRSRLEARWACFLSLAGFQWDYEPIDLPGWTPDFSLTFPDGDSRFVEIKPFTTTEQIDLEYFKENLEGEYVYLFGSRPLMSKVIPGAADIGWTIFPDKKYPSIYPVTLLIRKMSDLSYRMELGNAGYVGADSIPASYESVEKVWRQSGNTVQWKKNNDKT